MQTLIIQSLAQIPCFAAIPPATLATLAQKAKQVKFEQGVTIISEGEQTTSLYIVLSGKLKVCSSAVVGKAVDLLILEAGAFVGEMALLTGEPRAASVTTLVKTTCALLERKAYQSWLQEHEGLNIDLLQIIADKVAYMQEKTHQLTLSCIYDKLVALLKERAEIRTGALVVPVQPSINELAELIGVAPKLVKEVMKELLKNKYLVSKGQALHISLDLPPSW